MHKPPLPSVPTRYAVLPGSETWPSEIITNGLRTVPRLLNGVTMPDGVDFFIGGYESRGLGKAVLAMRSRQSTKLEQAVEVAPLLAAAFGLPNPEICNSPDAMLDAGSRLGTKSS